MKKNPSIRTYTFEKTLQVCGKFFTATVIVTHSQYRVLEIDLKFDLMTLAQLMSVYKNNNLDLQDFIDGTRHMVHDIIFEEIEENSVTKSTGTFKDVHLISHEEYRAWQLLAGVDTKKLSNGYGLAIRDCLDNPTAKKVKQLLRELQENGKSNPDMMQQIIGCSAMAAIASLPNY